LKRHNIEFTCRPESVDQAAVQRTALLLNRLHPGGQVQRFVIFSAFFFSLSVSFVFKLEDSSVTWVDDLRALIADQFPIPHMFSVIRHPLPFWRKVPDNCFPTT